MKSITKTKNVTRSIEIVVGRAFAVAPRRTNGYQENILIKLAEIAQQQIKGVPITDLIHNIKTINQWGDKEVTIKLAELTDPNLYKNYKRAVLDMAKTIMKHETDDVLLAFPMIQRVIADKRTGIIKMQIPKELWDCILNFTKNASMFNPDIALKLPTAYSKRMYELIANSKHNQKIRYSVETLNKYFNSNYQASNLRIKILEPAKKALDDIADWSFAFTPYPTDDEWTSMTVRGKRPIHGWIITPFRKHGENDAVDKALIKKKIKKSGINFTPKEVRDWLILNIDFTRDGLKNNDVFLYECLKLYGNTWESRFQEIKNKMDHSRSIILSRPGYFLTCLANDCTNITTKNKEFEEMRQSIIQQFNSN